MNVGSGTDVDSSRSDTLALAPTMIAQPIVANRMR